MSEIEQIRNTIEALEAQRAALGDVVVDASIAALRKQLGELQWAPAAEERKLVSILFADLVGFTSMAEKLDPEDVRAIQQAYFSAVSAPIKKQAGVIEKYIGDAVMAVFGLPRAEESDPDHAVLAALGMQAALRELNDHLETDLRIRLEQPLQMRVGVNTGMAIVSIGGPNDFSAAGDTVNLAHRLQSSAPAGGVLISQATYRHIRGAFDLQALDPISMKGKREPLPVYLVTGAKKRSFRTHKRGVEGIETRMIGRDMEQAAIRKAFITSVQDQECKAISIIADPGMGKSRLIYEFENWIELRPEQVNILRGRARLETQHLPHGMFRDIFAFRFGIQDDDPLPAVWRKLELGLREDGSPGVVSAAAPGTDTEPLAWRLRAHFIGQFLGYDFSESPYIEPLKNEPARIQALGSSHLLDYFRLLVSRRPLIFLLDDLHWADETSLDLISQLANELQNKPVMLLATARPFLYERRPGWMEGQDFHRRMDLQPLNDQDSRLLVGEVLQKVSELPEALRDLVVTNAEGNPFYVEELIKMLIEGGVILKGETDWRVLPERLTEVHIPSTLTEVLQARLDRLPDAEHLTIQQASVIGRVFWDSALSHLNKTSASALDKEGVSAALTELRQKEMVYRRELSIFAGSDEFGFKHAMLREVAYGSLVKRLRRKYHRLAAEWLSEVTQASSRIDEYTGLIAEHYLLADEGLIAADWLIRAGERATLQGAVQEAGRFFDRALENLPAGEGERRWKAMFGKSTVQTILGQEQEYRDFLSEWESLAKRLGNEKYMAEIKVQWAGFLTRHGADREAITAFQAAIESARRSGEVSVEARALALMGISYTRLGEHQAAREAAEAGVRAALQSGHPEKLARVFNNAAVTFIELGEPAQAIAYLNQASSYYEKLGDVTALGNCLNNMGYQHIMLGMVEQALPSLERALKLQRAASAKREVAYITLNLGLARIRMGQAEAVLPSMKDATDLLGGVGDDFGKGCGLLYQGLAFEETGKFDRAADCFREAIGVHERSGIEAYAADGRAGLSRSMLAMGDLPGAVEQASVVWKFLEEHLAAGLEFPIRAYLTCAEVFQQANQAQQAREALEKGYRQLSDRGARIEDASWRECYMSNIPEHRKLLELWELAQK